MQILAIQSETGLTEFEHFLDSISAKLAENICKKLAGYREANEVYSSNSLKVLKAKIWGYKGTIYKLRVDCGKESARVLFMKSPGNGLVLLHGFIKRTQKTPKKDAKISISNMERVEQGVGLHPLKLEKYFV
jgi:phage-related protein